MLELGNFDAFYEAGLRLTSLDILDMTTRTKQLHPGLPLSVTVPHWLKMEEQAQLADSLQALGVDVIQTEGSPSVVNLRYVCVDDAWGCRMGVRDGIRRRVD